MYEVHKVANFIDRGKQWFPGLWAGETRESYFNEYRVSCWQDEES